YEQGAMKEASTLFKQAHEATESKDSAGVIEIVRLLGLSAPDTATYDAAAAVLEGIRGRLKSSNTELYDEASLALVEVRLAGGQAAEVVKLVTAAGAGGMKSHIRPVHAVCAEARAFAVAGDPSGPGRLRRCISTARGELRAE